MFQAHHRGDARWGGGIWYSHFAGQLSSYDGGVLVVALPGGVCDLPSVMPLTTPKIITGAGVGTTTLRGSCGVGGIAAAGARVDARKIQNTCDTGQTRNKRNRLQTRAKGTRRAEQQKDIRKSTGKQYT